MHGCLGLYSVGGQRETNVRSALYRHSHVIPVSFFFCMDKAERAPVYDTCLMEPGCRQYRN